VLLLPHGYEGQGPEHSSARLERFLQLAAEDNMRVANCTTPAQYFHLLRRQAHLEELRPLIIMTPKSLLRHPRAVSTPDELTDGSSSWSSMTPPPGSGPTACGASSSAPARSTTTWWADEARKESEDVAVVRVEQLYPFPEDRLAALEKSYPNAEELVWVQEEPANMGAWTYMRPWLQHLAGKDRTVGYVGRPERASPAEGYKKAHDEQQARIVREAFAVAERASIPRSSVTMKESSSSGPGRRAPSES
jgi:2-oxoglutarate dehydrogenase E1 component